MFEDEEDSMFFDDDENVKKVKSTEDKKKFGFFTKNKKQKTKKAKQKKESTDDIINEEVIQEGVAEEVTITSDEPSETYINDSELVYIKEVEVFGNNLLDVFVRRDNDSQKNTRGIKGKCRTVRKC